MTHAPALETADLVQRLLAQALPPAFARTILSYAEFSTRPAPDLPKDFTAYHNACKAALGHIGALIKIREAGGKNAAGDKEENLEELLRQARRLLSAGLA